VRTEAAVDEERKTDPCIRQNDWEADVENSREPVHFWSPAIEVRETGGNLVILAELPGVKPDEVQVEIDRKGLTIQGQRTFQTEDRVGDTHRVERSYGSFSRSIALPEGADTGKATAKFQDGVLEVTVPIAETSGRRPIPLQEPAKVRGREAKYQGLPYPTYLDVDEVRAAIRQVKAERARPAS
jgi:HSP20 family protein